LGVDMQWQTLFAPQKKLEKHLTQILQFG